MEGWREFLHVCASISTVSLPVLPSFPPSLLWYQVPSTWGQTSSEPGSRCSIGRHKCKISIPPSLPPSFPSLPPSPQLGKQQQCLPCVHRLEILLEGHRLTSPSLPPSLLPHSLVNSNSAFIASIVQKYYLTGVDSADLYQEGVAGFLKAAHQFDEVRPRSLPSSLPPSLPPSLPV